MMFKGSIYFVLFVVFNCLVLFVSVSESLAQELKNPELSPAQNCREERHAVAQLNCFAELAGRENDVALCDSVSSVSLKYQCYAVYAGKKLRPEVCRQIPGGDIRDGCLSSLAGKSGNQKLCEEIKTVQHMDSCYAGVVMRTGQIELCGKIGDRIQQMVCSGSFSQ